MIIVNSIKEDLLERFKVASLDFVLEVVDNIKLPIYKGAALRGGFGKILLETMCTKRDFKCEICQNKYKCIYSQIFNTPIPMDSTIFNKIKQVPRPFIIEPPLEIKSQYEKGEKIIFKLILIGNVINFYHYFIYSFEELGKTGIGKGKGHYKIKEVIDNRDGSILLGNGVGPFLLDTLKELPLFSLFKNFLPQSNSKGIKLNFLTPTRIVFRQKLIDEIPFYILISNLIRRTRLLLYFHHKIDISIDYKRLLNLSQKIDIKSKNLYWYDWERYSSTQKTKIKLGGFIGDIIYEGVLEEFLPLLFLGSYIHIGKGTTFGLGKYFIEKNDEF